MTTLTTTVEYSLGQFGVIPMTETALSISAMWAPWMLFSGVGVMNLKQGNATRLSMNTVLEAFVAQKLTRFG